MLCEAVRLTGSFVFSSSQRCWIGVSVQSKPLLYGPGRAQMWKRRIFEVWAFTETTEERPKVFETFSKRETQERPSNFEVGHKYLEV